MRRATLAAWAVLLAACAGAPAAAPPGGTPTVVTRTPSPATTARPTPTRLPSPTPAPAYTSAALGYRVDLPPPWRRAACSSDPLVESGLPRASDIFVAVAEVDEHGTEAGLAYPHVSVVRQDNPTRLTPRQWLEAGRTIGTTAAQRIDDVAFAGRPAARVAYSGSALATYAVADREGMVVVIPRPLPGADEALLARIAESFRFLSDDELRAARAAATPSPPPRSPEEVADTLARAFAARDVAVLASVLGPCVTQALESLGTTFKSRAKYLDDLRESFATGTAVTVRPRPLEGDRATGRLRVGSEWTFFAQARSVDLLIQRGEGERWEWAGTFARRPQ